MSDYTITIRMRGDDQLSNVVKQVSGEVQNLGTKSESAGNKTGGLKSALGQFKSELLGLGTAFGVVKFAQFIGDMNELGMQVNAAQNTFTSLSGGAAAAADNLELMQISTRGVVDDMTLMNAANRLLLMGLASTGDEAAKLAGGAVALGKAMGQDAQTAVEGFAALLANKSIPRLDNFGISAARVRERIDELKASGMGIDEAFNAAVLAEMQVSLDKLGPSLDANATAFERWGTRVQNATQDFASNIAAGAEGLALALEVITQTDVGHEHLRQVAKDQAAAYVETFVDQMASRGIELQGSMADAQAVLEKMMYAQMTGGDIMGALVDGQEGIRAFGEDIALGTSAVDDFNVQMAYMGVTVQQATDEAAQGAQQMRAELQLAGSDLGESISRNMGRAASESAKAWDKFAAQGMPDFVRQRTLAGAQTIATGITDIFNSIPARISGFQTGMNQALQPRLGALKEYSLAAENMVAGLTPLLSGMNVNPEQLFGSMKATVMPEFMRPEAAQAIYDQYAMVEQEFQRMSELNAQGLITDDELARMGTFRDNMSNINDQAQAAAEAFHNMSLTDLLGTTGGGVMGEISDIVLQTMKDAGMSEEAIAASQRQMDLASGRETMSSFALEEAIAPMLAQMQPGEQVMAMQNLTAAMEQLALQGGDINALTTEQIMGMTGFTGGSQGAGFEIKPGETLGEVQARLAQQGYQLAISDLLAATGATSTATVQPGQYNISQPGAVAGFDPLAYVQSLLNPATKTATMPDNPVVVTEDIISRIFKGVLSKASEDTAGLTTTSTTGGLGFLGEQWKSFMGTMATISANAPMMGGAQFGGAAGPVPLTMGATPFSAMGANGQPVSMSGEVTALQESLPTVSALMLPIQESSTTTADNFATMQSSMVGTIAASEELNGKLTTLPSDVFVKVHIEAVDPNGVLGVLNSGAAQLGASIRNNGGRVPGRDSRIPE